MRVIFTGSSYFSVNESKGVRFEILRRESAAQPTQDCIVYTCGKITHTFEFSPGAYNYESWLEEVCSMVIDAKQIHITDVEGDMLHIATDGGGGRNEARLEKTGECYVGNNIYDGSEK